MELVYQAGLTEDATIECAISGARILPTDAELAHMVPVAIGGAHHIDNVKWVSKDINRMMGQMSYNEFVELCRAVVRIADANGH